MEQISQKQLAHMFEHPQRVQDLACWLERKLMELRLSTQQQQNKLTLADIQALATQLEFNFESSPQEEWFDLDKRGNSSLGGTFCNDETGIAEAYSYLVRSQHNLEQSTGFEANRRNQHVE